MVPHSSLLFFKALNRCAIGILEITPSHRIGLRVWFDLEPRRNDRDRSTSIIAEPSYRPRANHDREQQQEIDPQADIIGPPTTRMTEILDQQRKTGWPHLLLTILGREKLMHIVLLNIARRIDRAKVANRAIFATSKSLNSQMMQNMKSPSSNPHARTAKLCGYSLPTIVQSRSIDKFRAFLSSR